MPRIEDNARDEHFWHAIAQRYDVAPGPINLENGYFGRMTRGVAQDYQRQVDFINRSNSVHVRQRFDDTQSLEIRAHLADMLKVEPGSIALTNRASDALQSLIRNYTGLQPGDQLLICDLEYHSVEYAMRWVAQQHGLEMIEITHAHPATYESLLKDYNLLTVARNGSACGSCIRITVGMATTRDDIHQLIRALRELAVG